MNDILFTSIRLNELELLIQNSVEKALRNQPKEADSTEDENLFFTVQQTADFLKLTVSTIYSKSCRGELPVMKKYGRLYYSKKELINYVKTGRRKTKEEIETFADNYTPKKKLGKREFRK